MYLGNTKGGISILGLFLIAVFVILALSYFHISIRAVVESPDTQDNVHYVGGATKDLWTAYFKEPLSYLWNKIWIPYFWDPFVDTLKRLKAGEPIEMQNSAKLLPNGY